MSGQTGESDPRAIRRVLTADDAQTSGGLRLSAHQLAHLRTRLMVQPPRRGGAPDTMADLADRAKRLQGMPLDVLFTLESLRLLADGGNQVAANLYQSERIKLGIDRPFHSYRR